MKTVPLVLIILCGCLLPSARAADLFGEATVINFTPSDTSVSLDDTTVGRAAEPGEPRHAGLIPQSTTWYQITVPEDRRLEVVAAPDSGEVVMVVYTGPTISSLVPVNRYPTLEIAGTSRSRLLGEGGELLSREAFITFDAEAGVTYFIVVGSEQGNPTFELTVSEARDFPTPAAEILAPGADWEFLQAIDPAGLLLDPALNDPDFAQTWTTGLNYDGPAFRQASPAPHGYGNVNALPNFRTPLQAPQAGNRAAVTYLRTTIASPPRIFGLAFEGLVDDGAIIYVNGQEVARMNMPDSPSTFDLPALGTTIPVGTAGFDTEDVRQYALVEGLDLPAGAAIRLAVSIHNQSNSSTDMGFDLRVYATSFIPQIVRIPIEISPESDPNFFEIQWLGSAGTDYRIEFSTSLEENEWTLLDPNPIPGRNGINRRELIGPSPKGFWRVLGTTPDN